MTSFELHDSGTAPLRVLMCLCVVGGVCCAPVVALSLQESTSGLPGVVPCNE